MRSTAWLVVLAACGSDDKSKVLDAPAMIDAAIDAPLGCTDDMLADPLQTPVDTQRMDFVLAGLAICPATEKDRFAVTMSMPNRTFEVIVTTTSENGAVPMVSITNASGSAVANGTPMGTDATRACVANVPGGTYFAVVQAAQTTQYRLEIAVVPNC